MTDFQKQADRIWERLFAWHPPLHVQFAWSVLLVLMGFLFAQFLYTTTGTYFTFVTILTVVAISFFAEVVLAFVSAVIMSMLGDYFFIPPIGGIFEDRDSFEHFTVVVGASLVTAFVIASLRSAFRRATALKYEAEQAKREAEQANSAKSTFLANMSHEIRTPLGAVMGFAELVGDNQVGPSERANYVIAIKRNGELLANIINDILDLSKVEAGKMVMDVRETALAEVLTDTKMLLGLQAKEKGIALNLMVDEGVPTIFKSDPLRLRQVLINIVGNAIKFTDKGSVDIAIRHFVREGRPNLEFSVTDSGRGIDQSQVGKLFATFSQANITSKQRYGGIGLGLVLSKRIANLLGGDVVLTSTEFGKGSTFTITIDPGPLHGPFYNELRQETLQPAVEINYRLSGLKVLLADDSPDNQTLISRILKLAGATVDMASNGKEAVEMAMHHPYNVLLMDLQMPVMDGFEATNELRKKGYRGKIVALTAHALNDDKNRCLENGFDGHLGKPVNRAVLIQELRSLSLART